MARFTAGLMIGFLVHGAGAEKEAEDWSVEVTQITHGPLHHFYGYIGHVRNTPWNGNGRYLIGLQTDFQERMPTARDAADIVLIDTQNNFSVEVLDQTRAWNFQQGTMLYWNPVNPDTQFLFNDRDPETGEVFAVLYDIEKRARVRTYRDPEHPVGNSGVAQEGGYFLGINYARLARLRPVTGYPESYDWTVDVEHPQDDGIFKIDLETGQQELLVSYHRIAEALRPQVLDIDNIPLFINHTLCSRSGDWIYFFARGNWEGPDREKFSRIDRPFTVRPDGSDLTLHERHIGGHPEWAWDNLLIGRSGKDQILYDCVKKEIAGTLGNPEIFPKPEGDVALSPDGEWLVNGYSDGTANRYVFYRPRDGLHFRSPSFDQRGYVKGDLRNDPAPCWNREGNAILIPGFDEKDGTRQMYLLEMVEPVE
jgi:hypothetical protein